MRATVERVTLEHGRQRRVTLLKAVLRDRSGVIIAVWFNQPWLAKVLEPGMELSLRGSVRLRGGGASFVVKAHEILADEGETVHTEGIVPVYPASESISARVLRDLVHEARRAARSVPDPLSGTLRAAERLPAKADAVLAIHAPRSHPEAAVARERLVLEELLLMQLGLLLHKQAEQQASRALALGPPGETAAGFLAGLPFALTDAPGAGDRRDRRRPRARPRRCGGCCRATSAPARRWSPCTPCCERSRRAIRAPSWRPPRRSPSSTSRRWRRCSGRSSACELLTSRLTAAERRAALGRHRLGRRGDRRRHARSHPGRRRVRATWRWSSSTSSTASGSCSATRWRGARPSKDARRTPST